jgi:hypothetical protein
MFTQCKALGLGGLQFSGGRGKREEGRGKNEEGRTKREERRTERGRVLGVC